MTEEASYYYEQLLRAVKSEPVRKAYSLMNRTFRQLLDQHTQFADLHLSGTFAKTDYLLKHHAADPALHRQVNAVRSRLRRQGCGMAEDTELTVSLREDYEALCRMVSLVCHEAIPEEAAALFAANPKPPSYQSPLTTVMRVVVNRWDETNLYATAENGETVTVRYAGSSLNNHGYDWSPLAEMLFPQAQINVVYPVEHEGVLYPGLLILEPDYLVDITTIASCFESYSRSPMVALIHRLKPTPCSEAILLGQFADQLLDEAMHQDDTTPSYAESAQHFFERAALPLMNTPIGNDFHRSAKLRQTNIQRAVRQTLPSMVRGYDASEVMLEPSFFSEMLGIQGRMDFLQLDHKVLIEHKSGKCGWPQSDPETPVLKEQHYVQTLLYMTLLRYNYREVYQRNHQNGNGLQAFVMYSMYPNSLLGVGYAPRLVFEALMMRNGIVRNELSYADGGMRVLEYLTVEQLNTLGTKGKLWEQYTRPELESLLNPIQQASPLERAYYFRFLTFVAREHLLSKVGSHRQYTGFASVWHESLEEKIQTGSIYNNLTLIEPSEKHCGSVTEVVLGYGTDGTNEMADFRPGDIVILYPYKYGDAPDVRKTMVFRGTLLTIGRDRLRLRLRAAQGDAMPLRRHANNLWAIEHDYLDASYGGACRALHGFLSAPKERRDLILLQRHPRIDPTLDIQGDYGDFNDLVRRVKRARELFLIIGPPGTGKTSYGLVNTLREELHSADSQILLMAYTNRAVDEICEKLIEQKLDFIRFGGEAACGSAAVPYLLSHRIRSCTRIDELRKALAETRIIVGTTAAINSSPELLKLKHFSLAIIDEASQLLEPQIIGLLAAHSGGVAAIERVVMIGDHKQLPAVVQQSIKESCVNDPLLKKIHLDDCRLSLFERLLKQYRDDPDVVYMLHRQGRMHSAIADFPSRWFYQGLLRPVPLPHQTETLPAIHLDDATIGEPDGLRRIVQSQRFAFFNVLPNPDISSDKVNQPEARLIAQLTREIYHCEHSKFSIDHTIGIIVPYRNQIATVRNAIEGLGITELENITIDTVERYQGSQRDYIIYGFTVQQPYQLDFITEASFEENGVTIDRKLNVALTRARQHEYLIGNAPLLCRIPLFAQLIDYAKELKGYHNMDNLKAM